MAGLPKILPECSIRDIAASAVAACDSKSGDAEDEQLPTDPLSAIDRAIDGLALLSPTERESVILARVGQGVYRSQLIDAWDGRCSVTGTTVLAALVASHIKPWIAASNAERLDAANGLLLVGTLDHLFDEGLITFDDDGAIDISPTVSETEYSALDLSRSLRLRHVPPAALPYASFTGTSASNLIDLLTT